MSRPWQVGYNAHCCNTVTVEADTLGEALEKAIETANGDADGWRSTDHCSDSFCDSVCEDTHADPWGEGSLPVPDRSAEGGAPPLVTVFIDPGGKPAARVEGGRVRIRIRDE